MEPTAAPVFRITPALPEEVARRTAALDEIGDTEGVPRVRALNALAASLPLAEAERQLALGTEAYALATRLGDAIGQARAAGLRGRALFVLSENEAALPLLAEAIARFESLGMTDDALSARAALAGAHMSLGFYEEALAGGLANLEAVRASGDRVAEGWTLNGLSTAYADLGDADRALDAAQQAREAFTAGGSDFGRARAETSMGAAYLVRGDADAAEASLRSALTVFHRLEDIVGESRVLDDLGTTARIRGDLEAGLALHREALGRRRALANRHAQSTSLLHIGQALVALGRPAEAIEALDEARALAASVGARPREAQVCGVLVDAYAALGDPTRALAAARAQMEAHEAVLDAQTRSRLQTMQVRFETERLREAKRAETARAEALADANGRLIDALGELRAAQRQLVQTEKLSSLGRVTAGIAHEIRNPLNFVVGFSGLAVDLIAELREILDTHPIADPAAAAAASETLALLASNAARVDEHARRANDIVTGMLEHSRAIGGPRGQVGLSEVLDAAIIDAQEVAPGGLRLVREGDDVEIEAAPGALRRAFTNLISNAFLGLSDRALAPPDGWTPTLTLAVRRTGDASVEVTVEDNGVGIAPDAHALIFEPFYTTRPAGQGTGLGLSLAYDIVTEGHAGRLDYRDTPGDGATFVVTLPVSGS